MKEIKITNKNLFGSILLLVVGILLLTSSSQLMNILSYTLGGILIVIGISKLYIFYKMKKENNYYDSLDLILSILSITCGLFLILVPNIIDVTFRILFGSWILISGINRLILGLTVKESDSYGFKIYLISSILMIFIGLFVLFNFFGIIGVYLIIYSISDIVGYVYSIYKEKPQSKKKSKAKKNNKVKKSIKEKKAIDAEIVE